MKEGLRAGSAQKSVAVGTSSTAFLSPNPDRISIVISCPPTQRITLSLDNPVVSGVGLTLNPGNPPLLLTAKYHGDMVGKQWFAIADNAAQTVGLYEIILPGINSPELYDRYPMGG